MLSCSHFGEQDQPFLRSLEWLPEHGSAKQQPSYIKGKCWDHQEACNYVSQTGKQKNKNRTEIQQGFISMKN